MGYWERVIEAVSKINTFVITGDGRLGWEFLIYGRLGKDDISSLKNQKYFDIRGRDIVLGVCDTWGIGQGLSDIITLNN